ncbi:translocase [Pseudotabrizicola algicola]|uniref:Protein translocase subunit SecA n=1 Tax=Pseudotabrizicola algicola TaxID=2709381 RepID=A0A6B3RMZ5_9RHOB|nr:translocase [Pseudotabrizicola algicola]NEX46563.1 translocase [Pseudotabrizicola algicola]
MSDLAFHAASPLLRLPQVQDYAERPDVEDKALDRWWQRASGLWMSQGTGLRGWRLRAILPQVRHHAAEMAVLEDAALQQRAAMLRPALRAALARGRPRAAAIGPAFALVREVAGRQLGMRHFDVQLTGAWAMMQGMVAEMRTGEGKTLCATLAAATMALGGTPVHVITVNDYLAHRDAELMRPLYTFLGLTVGVVQAGQSEAERQAIYQADIVHASNKEIAFDYLRDRMVLRRDPGNLRRKLGRIAGVKRGPLRMRGLHCAIIDEADSVLIDEARTPLIISGQSVAGLGRDTAMLRRAMGAALDLTETTDYRVKANERRVELTDLGKDRLEDMAEAEPDASGFGIRVIREHAVVQALTALHVFHRDEDYILRDGKVQIVDENTGRVMADRSWSEGLHQMVELKEGVELTDPRETLSRITYQRFFRRYARLAGMTGTARDAGWELWSVYGLRVARIPTNRPDIRRFAPDRVLRDEDAKWRAIAERVADLHAQGAPVLLGTRSVAASETASARLATLGIPHQVLSAAQDADEAEIVARAGQAGAVTVATNIAGRGTDIKLGAGVAAFGGLHVILTERHDSRRVDRQLEGRCGRQGDPGRVEAFLSLEDELMRGNGARLWRGAASLALALGPRAAGVFIRRRQRQIERLHARMRHDLLEVDRNLGGLLAFSGQME